MTTDDPGHPPAGDRAAGLDGLRGLAALYVLLSHCWLVSWPGYPANNGPSWLGWLVYGHLAVVVFITLSGFSLALAPARRGWRLGGLARFARRRAWRILPPYWAALAFSVLVAWTVAPQPGSLPPDGWSTLVHALLLQDDVPAGSPNLAFWSIAVEVQLYLLFPLLVLLHRRRGGLAVLVAVAGPVVALGLLVPAAADPDRPLVYTPQLAVPFVLGLLAAGVLAGGERTGRVPWAWISALIGVPLLVLIVTHGSVWIIERLYWLDMLVGAAVAPLLAALGRGRPRALVRLLDTAPVRRLGACSYSLYLVHLPVVVGVRYLLDLPRWAPGLSGFLLLVAVAGPVSLLVAGLFAAGLELPVQRHRGWAELRAALVRRGAPRTIPAPAGLAVVRIADAPAAAASRAPHGTAPGPVPPPWVPTRRPARHPLVRAARVALAERVDTRVTAPRADPTSGVPPLLGVPEAHLRRLLRELVLAHPLADADALHEVTDALWTEASCREERYLALGLLGHARYADLVPPGRTAAVLRRWTVAGGWWDVVDRIAEQHLGRLLREHPTELTPVLRDWTTAPDRWLRRASITCQVGAGDRTDRALLRDAITANLHDPDDAVRSGIDWALSRYAQTDPGWVAALVAEHPGLRTSLPAVG